VNNKQSNNQKGVKVLIKKQLTTQGKKYLEIKLEADGKLFCGTDWLASLGRIQSFEESIKDALIQAVFNYIESAKKELKS
jgi:hypothetical protein